MISDSSSWEAPLWFKCPLSIFSGLFLLKCCKVTFQCFRCTRHPLRLRLVSVNSGMKLLLWFSILSEELLIDLLSGSMHEPSEIPADLFQFQTVPPNSLCYKVWWVSLIATRLPWARLQLPPQHFKKADVTPRETSLIIHSEFEMNNGQYWLAG